MTDKMEVYTKVLKTMKQLLPTMPENRVVVLAMLVAGIVTGLSDEVAQSKWCIAHFTISSKLLSGETHGLFLTISMTMPSGLVSLNESAKRPLLSMILGA